MTAPLSSACYPSTKQSSESFLFLPQLPVNGDDDGKEDNVSRLSNHYLCQCNKMQQASSLVAETGQSSSAKPANAKSSSSDCKCFLLTTDYKNDYRKNSCQRFTLQSAATRVNFFRNITNRIMSIIYEKPNDCCSCRDSSEFNSDHVCGGASTSYDFNSSLSFPAANDTAIGSPSTTLNDSIGEKIKPFEVNFKSALSKQEVALQNPFSSSTTIFIRNNSTNKSHNYNHSPFCFAANHQPRSHLHRFPHRNRDHHQQHSRRRLFLLRICQAFCIFFGVVILSNIARNLFWVANNQPDSSSYSSSSLSSLTSQNRLVQSWNMPSIISLSSASSASHIVPHIDEISDLSTSNSHNLFLLDLPNFRFLMNNTTKCNIQRDDDNYNGDGTTNNNNDTSTTIFFMIIVHSAPKNWEARQAIRETWGSLQRLLHFQIRLVFLLGQNHQADSIKKNETRSSNYITEEKHNKKFFNKEQSILDFKLKEESKKYGDIVAGNFYDTYRNLTYKHLMGYFWVLNYCPHAKFVLKADDDAFIDIFQLFTFVLRTFGEDPEAALICNVFPEGTKPVRRTDTQGKKWAVTYEEFPFKSYPKYCGGLAYLATPNVIQEIYKESQSLHNKYFWIDDVFVTGILRKLARVEPFYLNLRYSYDPEEYRKWLRDARASAENNNDNVHRRQEKEEVNAEDNEKGVTAAAFKSEISSNEMNNERRQPAPPQKIPFMIVHLERGRALGREMRELWSESERVWSKSGLVV